MSTAARELPGASLPQTAVLRLLVVLAIVLGPHLARVPAWAVLLVVGVMLWRLLAALRGLPLLPRPLRMLLTLAAFAGIYATFGRVSGQTAGVALITVMAALKLTELRARRDTLVMVFLMYFMLITHFLFSQAPWTAVYLLACTGLITAVLIDANHPGTVLPLRTSLRIAGALVLQALPLMVVIFVLFPRIPGPLWGLPADSGAARGGLSDSMSPGDIASLIQSDEVAFRVRFEGPAPPMRERYWRGPVFTRFDGQRWDAGPTARIGTVLGAVPAVELRGAALRYEVVLEPNRMPWLLALELPDRIGLPADAELTPDYQLVLAEGEVRERRLYRLQSHSQYRLQPVLTPAQRERALQLPKGSNPRSLALGERWREQGLRGHALIEAALKRFRHETYYYTLQPPTLGRNGIDEFLFDTRRGFCEHYAGSFTVLMRAAGLPARVVTGYLGGEPNEIGDYYIVRQSDAHAWSEVWLDGEGWVRVDATAAVAPERVERGLGSALAGDALLPSYLDPTRRSGLGLRLAARWDWANAQWNRWVLGYGPELQQDLLRRIGLVDWGAMMLALTGLMAVLLSLLGLLVLRASQRRTRPDPALREWQRLQRRLGRAGLPAVPSEGPQAYAGRVQRARPDLAEPLAQALRHYLALRYLQTPRKADLRALRRSVARIRP